jgi:hypothetical protein
MTSRCSRRRAGLRRCRWWRAARYGWGARWPRSVSPTWACKGSRPRCLRTATARGEIAALSGAQDDARYFQISVPVQPGNSGGALVDERGNVVGVVAAKLSARAALAASGSLPENVNYAVKSSFLLSFLESVPEVSAKLKDVNTKERKFEDVVKSAEQAAVLVLVLVY